MTRVFKDFFLPKVYDMTTRDVSNQVRDYEEMLQSYNSVFEKDHDDVIWYPHSEKAKKSEYEWRTSNYHRFACFKAIEIFNFS